MLLLLPSQFHRRNTQQTNILTEFSTEHKLATRKRRSAESLETSDAPIMIDPDEHLLQLPGVQRHLINLQGRTFEKALLWRLNWYNFV
jgi:hypothetical protein